MALSWQASTCGSSANKGCTAAFTTSSHVTSWYLESTEGMTVPYYGDIQQTIFWPWHMYIYIYNIHNIYIYIMYLYIYIYIPYIIYIYIYYPHKKKNIPVYYFYWYLQRFFAYFGGFIFNVFVNKFGHSFEGEYHIYILYNRGCRQICETWWFWHQEVLGGPRTSLEPRTKIAQKVLGESWFLVLGSKEVLGPLSSSSCRTMP